MKAFRFFTTFVAMVCVVISVSAVILTVEMIRAKNPPVNIEDIYPETAVVCDVDYKQDIVTVETKGGFQYQFYGVEDWMVDDVVSLLMKKNETESIRDDEIVMVTYSGFCYAQIAG